jgi:hypothetical protein
MGADKVLVFRHYHIFDFGAYFAGTIGRFKPSRIGGRCQPNRAVPWPSGDNFRPEISITPSVPVPNRIGSTKSSGVTIERLNTSHKRAPGERTIVVGIRRQAVFRPIHDGARQIRYVTERAELPRDEDSR